MSAGARPPVSLEPYHVALIAAYAGQWSVERLANALGSLYNLTITPAQLDEEMRKRGLQRTSDSTPIAKPVAIRNTRLSETVRGLRKRGPAVRLSTHAAMRIRKLLGQLADARSQLAMARLQHANELDAMRAAPADATGCPIATPSLALERVVARHLGSVEPVSVDRKLTSLMREVGHALHQRMASVSDHGDQMPPLAKTAYSDGGPVPLCQRCDKPYARRGSERICDACRAKDADDKAIAKHARQAREPKPRPSRAGKTSSGRAKPEGIYKACRTCAMQFWADPPNVRYCEQCRAASRGKIVADTGDRPCRACKKPFVANPATRRYCNSCRAEGIADGNSSEFVCNGCDELFVRKPRDGTRRFCYTCAPAIDLVAIDRATNGFTEAETPARQRQRDTEPAIVWRETPRCAEGCRHATPSADAYTGFICQRNAVVCVPFKGASLYEPR